MMESDALLLSVRIYRVIADCESNGGDRATPAHVYFVFAEYDTYLIDSVLKMMHEAGIIESEPDEDRGTIWLNTVPVSDG